MIKKNNLQKVEKFAGDNFSSDKYYNDLLEGLPFTFAAKKERLKDVKNLIKKTESNNNENYSKYVDKLLENYEVFINIGKYVDKIDKNITKTISAQKEYSNLLSNLRKDIEEFSFSFSKYLKTMKEEELEQNSIFENDKNKNKNLYTFEPIDDIESMEENFDFDDFLNPKEGSDKWLSENIEKFKMLIGEKKYEECINLILILRNNDLSKLDYNNCIILDEAYNELIEKLTLSIGKCSTINEVKNYLEKMKKLGCESLAVDTFLSWLSRKLRNRTQKKIIGEDDYDFIGNDKNKNKVNLSLSSKNKLNTSMKKKFIGIVFLEENLFDKLLNKEFFPFIKNKITKNIRNNYDLMPFTDNNESMAPSNQTLINYGITILSIENFFNKILKNALTQKELNKSTLENIEFFLQQFNDEKKNYFDNLIKVKMESHFYKFFDNQSGPYSKNSSYGDSKFTGPDKGFLSFFQLLKNITKMVKFKTKNMKDNSSSYFVEYFIMESIYKNFLNVIRCLRNLNEIYETELNLGKIGTNGLEHIIYGIYFVYFSLKMMLNLDIHGNYLNLTRNFIDEITSEWSQLRNMPCDRFIQNKPNYEKNVQQYISATKSQN